MTPPNERRSSDPLVVMLTDHIEREEDQFRDGAERMERIEQDLQPIKKMYWALMGSSGVMALLLAVLLYIYAEDKHGAKAMQEAIYKQGVAIERLLVSHTELEKDYRRDMTRIESTLDRVTRR